jgi:hypothetical protein
MQLLITQLFLAQRSIMRLCPGSVFTLARFPLHIGKQRALHALLCSGWIRVAAHVDGARLSAACLSHHLVMAVFLGRASSLVN